jgi:putative Mg2+ transporter-C (MgtC) family protein
MGEAITLTGILQSLGLTLVFVGLIGYERQKRHKIAGLTTHLMVALAAAGITLLQEVLVYDAIQFATEFPELAGTITFERQRIVAQVISGVGFLGTGAILKTQGSITGLTTASTLWASAIIGIIFGYGQIVLGISVSVLMLFVLTIIKAYIRNHQGPEDDHEI